MSFPSEETPLLLKPAHADVYSRFSKPQKHFILFVISLTGLLTLFVSSSFVPAMKQIADDIGTTGEVVSLAISVSMLGSSIGSMLFATYSTFYGRKPVLLVSLPLLCFASMGVGLAQNVPQLIICRFLQAVGGASGSSLGSGIIGDIYKMEERGTAMGIFFAAVLVGPAVAPFIAGLASHYASWRYMQYGLGVTALLIFVAVLLFFPETSQPGKRGIDKLLGNTPRSTQHWKWVWLNPFSSLGLLRSPNLLAVTVASSFIYLTYLTLLIPIAYTIGARYHIDNEAFIGLSLLSLGLGSMVGAPLAGRLSDRVVVTWRKRRGGVWVPEDRLRATLWGAGLLVPFSIILSGLVTHFVEGTPGLVINMFLFFLNGVGVDVALCPTAAYGVDVMHSRSAEVVAAASGFRSMFMSVATAGILPSLDAFGVAITNAIPGFLALIGFGLLWLTIRYGAQMRAWKDIGYSTVDNN